MADEDKNSATPEAPQEVKKEEKTEEKKPEAKKEAPDLKAGQKIRVHQRITEGKKERVQIFEGVIIAMGGQSAVARNITVRKVSDGVSVEKIFPLSLPTIEKIEVVSKLNVRKAKLYYLRDYKKKIKEEKV